MLAIGVLLLYHIGGNKYTLPHQKNLKERKAEKKATKEAKRAKSAIYLRNRRGGFLTSWMN